MRDFGVGVRALGEEIGAVHHEFFEGDFEVAIEEYQSDAVFGVESLSCDDVDGGDGFDEADGPRCVFDDFLVVGLEVLDV